MKENMMKFKQANLATESEKKARARTKNRNGGKYSQNDFRNLPEAEQIALLNEYLINRPAEKFDDGTFQFSRTTLAKLADEMGYKKSYLRDFSRYDANDASIYPDKVLRLYIERGNRKGTRVKKMTFSDETIQKMIRLVESSDRKLSNNEVSKIYDLIMNIGLDKVLEYKEQNQLVIAYPAQGETRLI